MNFLGLDTSNYTTSAAVFDGDKILSSRRILDVKDGERGLRQSDALFQHIKRLPDIVGGLGKIRNISAVGVSTRPRSVEGSYMPVFLAGCACAKSIASVLSVPLFEFSHQDGHIMAGVYSAKEFSLLEKPFVSVHLSGGTSEILLTEYNGKGFNVTISGGTKDISAGQVIDRTGVMLGYKFPCGAELDKLSQSAVRSVRLPVSCGGGYFNFSGLETKAASVSGKPEEIARGVFEAIAETIAKSVDFVMKSNNVDNVLFVGGVASNTFIRNKIKDCFGNNAFFASPEMSTDNACGIAILTGYATGGF